jgi:hypothetical protein
MYKTGKALIVIAMLAGFVWLSVLFMHARLGSITNESDALIVLGMRITYFVFGIISVLRAVAWILTESCRDSFLFHHWDQDGRCAACRQWRPKA